VVSRVVMRIKRQELSHAIQAEGARVTRHAHQLLNPEESGIKLIKNRMVATAQNTVKSAVSLRAIPARIKTARAHKKQIAIKQREIDSQTVTQNQGIEAPKSSWRDRLSSAYDRTSQGISGVAEDIQKRIERPPKTPLSDPVNNPKPLSQTPAQSDMPEFRANQVPTAPIASTTKSRTRVVDTAPRVETTAKKIQSLVKKKPKESPLKIAEDVIINKEYDQAEDILIPYIAEHPKNVHAYMLLGEATLGREAWDEAIEIFEQVLRVDASASDAQAQLGLAALKAGQFTLALQALQRAIDADPENTLVLKNLLIIAQRMDNKVLQKSMLDQLIVLEPDNPEIHSAAEAFEAKEIEKATAA